MAQQPQWRRLLATDYSQVFVDETGVYPPEMEIAQEYDTGKRIKFIVYRFPLERLKLVRAGDGKTYLVPIAYEEGWPHPVADYRVWFAKDLKGVASSIGSTKRELIEALTSDDVNALAWAYESIGGYHGYENLDGYPQSLTETQLNKRWS